jgi:hypothetical protein
MPPKPQIARRCSIAMIWLFAAGCAVFAFYPGIVPASMEPDPARGLSTLMHINGSRGMPSYVCYTYAWAAGAYTSLRIAILLAVAPFAAAVIFLYRTRRQGALTAIYSPRARM